MNTLSRWEPPKSTPAENTSAVLGIFLYLFVPIAIIAVVVHFALKYL
jgi:hypothetical protein